MIIFKKDSARNLIPFCIGSLLLIFPTAYGQANCEITWTKVLETSETGGELFGTKADLVDAIKSGADLRLYVAAWNYIAHTQNVRIDGENEVSAQVIMHLSRLNWDTFDPDIFWVFMTFSTTGIIDFSRWLVGAHTLVSISTSRDQVTWFVRKLSTSNAEPIYCNNAEGTTTCGGLQPLIQAIGSGADVRALGGETPTYNSTGFSNINFNNRVVAGQALWNVIQVASAYWNFIILSSDGNRDISRWNVGAHTPRGHGSDTISTNWFVDPCWTLAYRHDANGIGILGSLASLRSAVLNGHRVKMVIDGYSIESDNVQIKNGHVSGQFLGHVSKSGIQFFQHDVYWFWQLVATTGQAQTVRYYVGNTNFRGGDDARIPVSWYIDTRTWTRVLSVSTYGDVIFGAKSTLVNAVKAGAMLRYAIHFPWETLLLQADNIVIRGVDVSAEAIRVVSYTGANIRRFQNNPYWWFTIVTTQGNIRMSRWTVGAHDERGDNTSRAPVDWFVLY